MAGSPPGRAGRTAGPRRPGTPWARRPAVRPASPARRTWRRGWRSVCRCGRGRSSPASGGRSTARRPRGWLGYRQGRRTGSRPPQGRRPRAGRRNTIPALAQPPPLAGGGPPARRGVVGPRRPNPLRGPDVWVKDSRRLAGAHWEIGYTRPGRSKVRLTATRPPPLALHAPGAALRVPPNPPPLRGRGLAPAHGLAPSTTRQKERAVPLPLCEVEDWRRRTASPPRPRARKSARSPSPSARWRIRDSP